MVITVKLKNFFSQAQSNALSSKREALDLNLRGRIRSELNPTKVARPARILYIRWIVNSVCC